ncbi:Nuclear valosin-containing protein-like [Porphyridium purpureum]|uniref:Nuclear valosin-containing protein-like n=1 Tax=Porphyridium purpureum TaxID=35688 RepID=A0A5J4YUK1_PORPP|nr:Nuclear valosin-containing protein-like [Porphyridium purpureum]|eukprot:POR4310..scf227_4
MALLRTQLTGRAAQVLRQGLRDGELLARVTGAAAVEAFLAARLQQFRRLPTPAKRAVAAAAWSEATNSENHVTVSASVSTNALLTSDDDAQETAPDGQPARKRAAAEMPREGMEELALAAPQRLHASAPQLDSNAMLNYSRKRARAVSTGGREDLQEPLLPENSAPDAASPSAGKDASFVCVPASGKTRRPPVAAQHPTGSPVTRVTGRANAIDTSAPLGAGASAFQVARPRARLADVGGIDAVREDVRELVEWPLRHVDLYVELGVEPPRGVLLHGPAGCGKTLLAHAIAGELGVPFFKLAAPEVVSGMSGESERKLRELFACAVRAAPSLIFIDEVDVISARRDSANKDMERRIVAQLLACIDSLALEHTHGRAVLVLAATSRADALDPALRRAGRFDRELEIGAPDEQARAQILRTLATRLTLDSSREPFDFERIARRTAGYVGADLAALTTMAATLAVRRILTGSDSVGVDYETTRGGPQSQALNNEVPVASTSEITKAASQQLAHDPRTHVDSHPSEPSDNQVTESGAEFTNDVRAGKQDVDMGRAIRMDDFEAALEKVQPSALREGFTTVPDVLWSDVGALDEVRDELELAVVAPIRAPHVFASLGPSLAAPAGVLLYGPPGCGKTLLAKAVAKQSCANFISVKGPELLNKYVGESERSVRRLFQRARASAPCIIFFDELDALAPRRGSAGGGDGHGNSSSSGASERVVNQLLTELDGMDSRKQVFVIAATNRPDIIDPAMLRPGRLDKLLYVPLPDAAARASILRTIGRRAPLDPCIDLDAIARDGRCEGFSGADLSALLREAAMDALRQAHITLSGISDATGNKMGERCTQSPSERESGPQDALAQRESEKKSGLQQDLVLKISHTNFVSAFNRVFPSVSPRDARLYRDLQHKLRRSRAHLQPEADSEALAERDQERGSDLAVDADKSSRNQVDVRGRPI